MDKHDKKDELFIPEPFSLAVLQRVTFEEFYNEHNLVKEILSSKEWEETWKYFYEFSPAELEIDIKETVDDVNAYDIKRQMVEIIKCANNFSYFAHKYFKIQHPIKGALPFVLYKYQRRVIEQYQDHRFNILSKFRQGGLTTVSVAWAVWRCLFKLDQKILVMSKTDREAITAGEVAKFAMQELPIWLKPQMGKSNEHERQFRETNSILYFYTPEAARGKSITVLIIDEAAFIQNMAVHWKAMYPVISTGGQCCVVSTVNGLGNWYEEMYHEAEAGQNAFNVIELDYWEHPEYNNPKWVDDQRKNLGDKGWQQEILRSFLGSGDTFISSKIIGELDKFTRENEPLRIKFSKWHNDGSDKKGDWEPGALWIWKEPIDGHEYILSADCAEGMGDNGDNSCFQIIDVSTLEQVVEFYSCTVPPHIFAQVIYEVAHYYNTCTVVVENVGQGIAVLSNLQHDLAYEKLYHENKGRTTTFGLKTTSINRPVFLESLQNRLINGALKINSRRLVHELKTFIYSPQRKRAEAQRGKHDDAIMALSFAIFVRDMQMRDIPVGAEIPEEMMKIFKSEVMEEIKKEVMDGSPEDWFMEEEKIEPLIHSENEVLPGVLFKINRRNEKLLKEFGW